MGLTLAELARCAEDCMRQAGAFADAARFEHDARALLQRLVEDRAVTHRRALRLIRRALTVDISDAANRKGAVPKALGLVSRASKQTAIKHLAIVMMMRRLLEYSETDGVDGRVVFP